MKSISDASHETRANLSAMLSDAGDLEENLDLAFEQMARHLNKQQGQARKNASELS